MSTRPRQLHTASGHPNIVFWLAFLALNALLFAPFYLLNLESTAPWPNADLFADGMWLGVNRLFLWRDNLDMFRLSIELTVMTALLVSLPRVRSRLFRAIFAVLYFVALTYAVYEALVVSIWRSPPVFYSHYFLALDGLPFLAEIAHVTPWVYFAALVGLFVVGALISLLIHSLLSAASEPGFRRGGRVVMLVLAGLCLMAVARYQIYTASPEMTTSSLSFKLSQNIAASLQLYRDVVSFDDAPVKTTYNYVNHHLLHKPDIYLIFVESYGSVLYKRNDFRARYTALLDELQTQLAEDGWHLATALSESPTWGGGSWLAYTSLLFGLRIDNQPQYISLFNKYQVDDYPNLGRALQAQGYTFAWVSSISRELDEQIWSQYTRFMGTDRWLHYSDLDYVGDQYSWGAAPPDQYVLNYANELLKQSNDAPLFFVTLTQNSHYPWLAQPSVVEDWRTLRHGESAGSTAPALEEEGMKHAVRRQNYLKAIDYQLRMLTDFVLRNGDDDSLFIFIGDHQPPFISRRSDGFATPIHIVSKNAALIVSFGNYGFTPGLQLKTMDTDLHHEGFYSLLMRVLLEQDRGTHLALPAFLPSGITPGDRNGEVDVN